MDVNGSIKCNFHQKDPENIIDFTNNRILRLLTISSWAQNKSCYKVFYWTLLTTFKESGWRNMVKQLNLPQPLQSMESRGSSMHLLCNRKNCKVAAVITAIFQADDAVASQLSKISRDGQLFINPATILNCQDQTFSLSLMFKAVLMHQLTSVKMQAWYLTYHHIMQQSVLKQSLLLSSKK